MQTLAKNAISQLMPAAAQPVPSSFLHGSVTPIPFVCLRAQQLSRFGPVIILVPASSFSANNGGLPTQSGGNDSLGETSETSEFLECFGKPMAPFKADGVESEIVFGDVKVSFSSMEASRRGESVMLTALEFKTLKYLVQNARRVISRDELLNEVWGYENYPCTRTVDNHILRLRQKLEINPSRPVHFRTVHGAGYKFLP